MKKMRKNASFEGLSKRYDELCEVAPIKFFKNSWNGFITFILNTTAWMYFGTRWLFKFHPNITWFVICSIIVSSSLLTIGRERAERDKSDKYNLTLEDSIDKLTNNDIKYVRYNGK